MLELPTRIGGVQISRQGAAALHPTNPALRQPDRGRTWPAGRFRQQLAVEAGLTCEPNYTRHPSLQRAIRVVQGEVFVVAVDIRLGSPTFGQWQGFYLRAADGRRLLIPAGVACGWQSVSDASVEQRVSHRVQPHHWRWLRWNDPLLSIQWPATPRRLRQHPRPSCWLSSLPETALPNRERLNDPTDADHGQQVRSIRLSTPPGERQLRRTIARLLAPVWNSSPPPRPEERILVLGSQSPLGRELCLRLRPLGTIIAAASPTGTPENRLPRPLQVELHRPASLRQVLRQVQPSLVIHAGGLSDLEQAETNPRLAQLVNATAAHIIAEECEAIGAGLVHYCSAMVFGEGNQRPWRESDEARPLNQLGRTKLRGTNAVLQTCSAGLVLRSSWLFGGDDQNFITNLVDQLTYRNRIRLANDYLGTPTSLAWLAELTAQLLASAPSSITRWLQIHGGLYHAAPLGYASRLEVADHVLNICRLHDLPIVTGKLVPASLSALADRPPRPLNSRLDCSKLTVKFGIRLPGWQDQVSRTIARRLGRDVSPIQVA